jgi:hypothetical protein
VFNRAVMFNIGYAEAKKVFEFDCAVFHDVDLLPEDDRNFYRCDDDKALHLTSHIDKFKYK